MKLILPLAIIGLFLTGCSSFKVYKLDSGVTVLALRNLEKVYPVYAQNLKAELELALSTKGNLTGLSAKAPFESKVQQLYDSLDQINADARNQLIAAYTKYIGALGSARSAEERIRYGDAFDAQVARTANWQVILESSMRRLRP